jgi:hypothetical protein
VVCLRIEKPTLGAEIELRFLALPGFGPNADTIHPHTAKSSKKLKCSGDNRCEFRGAVFLVIRLT